MRALGIPSASTVASVMAVGSRGSLRHASSNQAANRRRGSSASVKSPLVNQVGCFIEADSDILRGAHLRALARVSQRCRYRAMLPQWHARRLPATICAATLAFLLTGCSFSYQLDNRFGKRDEADMTGSPRLAPKPRPIEEAPVGGDLEIARAAVNEVLAKAGNNISVPWENPRTGARGTI